MSAFTLSRRSADAHLLDHHTADAALGEQLEGLLPHFGEFFGIGMVIIVYVIALLDGYAMLDLANIVGPAIFSITVAFAAYRTTKLNVHAIWTPLFWYRIAMVTYMGVGSGMTSFYNAETRDLINTLFAFSPAELTKFNLVNASFHACVLCVAWLVIRVYRSARSPLTSTRLTIDACRVPLKTVGIAFLSVGMAANYLLIYPVALGILNITLSNAALQASPLAYIGYFLLTYWGLENKHRGWVAAMIALAAIDSIAGVLMLTKFAALFPVLMIPIAFIYHKASLRRILIAVAILVPFYAIVSSVVEEARSRVERDIGNDNRAIFSDTLVVLREIVQGKNGRADAPDYQLAWARLSYANAGTLGISFYDQGLEGNSLRDIFVVWIPRAIYPDKPVITEIGRDFTVMANGNYNSSTSPSIPSEGYWNAGWLGVAMFAMMLGIVLTLWSIYSTIVFDREAWHLLLVVLLGMRTGTRIDGFFVPDVVGPLSAVLAIHIACSLANRFLPRMPALRRRFA